MTNKLFESSFFLEKLNFSNKIDGWNNSTIFPTFANIFLDILTQKG